MGCCSSTLPSACDEVIDRFLDSVGVWQTIFEMLEVKDRIRLEMTNKRLGILMLEYWRRVTSFDTKCRTEMSEYPLTNKNRENLSAAFVSICVNRIGDGLRSLTIREKFSSSIVSSATLRSIGEGCPNVETINFIFERYQTLDNVRFDSFSRLKTLTARFRGGYFIEASVSVFLSIPTSIEVIRGLKGKYEEAFANSAKMEGFFAHRPSLREVCLGCLYTDDGSKADIFRVIAQRCSYLKSIRLDQSYFIDIRGVVALESMKELRLSGTRFDEMQIVTICERSHLVEVLEFRPVFSSNIDLQSTALNALGSLTKLRDFCLNTDYYEDAPEVAPSLVTEFVCELARNSGASLRRLHLGSKWDAGRFMSLSTAAIEALAIGCGKLRRVEFSVCVGEAEPASIRLLIDSIVAHQSWIPQTSKLEIKFWIIDDDVDEAEAGRTAFKALAAPAAHLPAGVELNIWRNNRHNSSLRIA